MLLMCKRFSYWRAQNKDLLCSWHAAFPPALVLSTHIPLPFSKGSRAVVP